MNVTTVGVQTHAATIDRETYLQEYAELMPDGGVNQDSANITAMLVRDTGIYGSIFHTVSLVINDVVVNTLSVPHSSGLSEDMIDILIDAPEGGSGDYTLWLGNDEIGDDPAVIAEYLAGYSVLNDVQFEKKLTPL